MIITRELINKNIKVYDTISETKDVYNYNSLSLLINRVKNTFLENGAQKGNIVCLIQADISLVHIAAIFASLELGMKLLVADHPATKEALPYCKMAMRGPVDFTIYDNSLVQVNDLLHRPWLEMITDYSKVVINSEKISTNTEPSAIWATEEDIALISSSSGTTNWSKSVEFTHNEVHLISNRNIKIFDYKSTDLVAQTKNLHHGGSLLISFLPALMTCDTHIAMFMPDIDVFFDAKKDSMSRYIKFLNSKGCNRITITNYEVFEAFLTLVGETIGKFDKTLTIIPFVFKSTPKLIEFAKQYNVEIHNTYGSMDSQMIPLAVYKINKDSEFIENYVGDWEDDGFYTLNSIGDHRVHTFEREDGRLCTIQDTIEIKDGKVYLYARAIDENSELRSQVERYITTDFAIVQNQQDKYLALFEETVLPVTVKLLGFKNILRIEKNLFYSEAKLNYDALRGHFIYYDKLKELL